MNNWTLFGQVGRIEKFDKCWMINLAHNEYKFNKKNGKYEKSSTFWLKVLVTFEPKFKTGDSVLAAGTFEVSKNPKFPFVLKANYVGLTTNGNKHQNMKGFIED